MEIVITFEFHVVFRGRHLDPEISSYYAQRFPSAIRMASIHFAERKDDTEAINVAIGNVTEPMYSTLQRKLASLGQSGELFGNGVVPYSATVGDEKCRAAFRHILEVSGFSTEHIEIQITDGGSQAMALAILGTCGLVGGEERPLLLVDPSYTNYKSFAERLGRRTVSIQRILQDDGHFSIPSEADFDAIFEAEHPGAIVVIPYDNPTGQFYSQEALNHIGRLCVKYNAWLISDEAYRELCYKPANISSVWGISEDAVPGITGRRISIETASKVWNACGLRIGALCTDSHEFHVRAVAENTAGLCSNVLGQAVFGALADEPAESMRRWYDFQRERYSSMMRQFVETMHHVAPEIVVSQPDTSLYTVIDVHKLVDQRFNSVDFSLWCAQKGCVEFRGKSMTLLTAPMMDFYPGYMSENTEQNPGRTQFRVAYVQKPELMAMVPELFVMLLNAYLREVQK